ncbi:MAG TPA: two-component regulator propeller domain-containing protein, partial [Prolixibacteraceae bacterium]|nr:two-component regulator propeller domain-containing protein [Prolixibacteraceae bacterium]
FEYIKLSASQGSQSANIACVTSITRDNRNQLWVGTDGGGLFRIAENGTKTRFINENTPLPNNAILTLTADKRGTLWISTYMGGITSYHPERGFQSFSNLPEVQKVMCSAYDSESDQLYLGTLGCGVKILSFSDYRLRDFPDSSQQLWVNSLCLDDAGNMWVGHTEGTLCVNTKTGQKLFPELSRNLKGTNINSIMLHRDGSVWFGSPRGLFHLNTKDTLLTSFSRNDGLPSNHICSILQDENDALWISTLNGLSKWDEKTRAFKNYYASDGLQDNEFRINSRFKDSGGKIYFGGINGITAFYPERITGEEKLRSKIYFSQLKVLNQDIHFDETLGTKNILDRHISQASRITLKKKQNIFSLEFAVLEYANPHKVVYGYMLKGFDTDWRYTDSNHRLATYTNLPEGLYVFRVNAFFEGCTEEQNRAYNEIGIRILPPWYKSWWAYLIYLALSMLIVWEFMNFLVRRKLRIQEQVEFEKKEMKLQMFTDLTHEIRTPFTMVMSPLNTMRESETDPKRKEMFQFVHRNILRILRLLNQLMDIRKIDNHQFKMHFQKTDLIFFIRDMMKSFEQLAIIKNIDFRLVSGFDALDVWIDPVNFDKVLYNILSNAFNFTHENGYILISLDTRRAHANDAQSLKNHDFFELCIENSGSRIDGQEIGHIFDRFYQSSNNKLGSGSGIGLHLARMIVQLHHGKIFARNVENGVAFFVQIPLGNKHLSAEEMGNQELNIERYSPLLRDNERIPEPGCREQSQTEKEHSERERKKTKRTLVFVDDDADLGNYIKMVLSEKYQVDVFTHALDAWKVISTTLPDAVVTDIIMPEVDGISLCRKIRQNAGTNHLPVIILTSDLDEERERVCFESGADHYLTKPINLDLLKSTIAQAIQTRDMLRNKYRANVQPDFDGIKMSSPDNRLIAKVIETIKANIENSEFSVDDLSREVGLSRVHLNRKLKANIDISPSNLIKSIRLKQAAYLLINNKVNISDVAYKVGFSSHSYFSNMFKDYFGMAPTEFVSKYSGAEEKESFNRLFENN